MTPEDFRAIALSLPETTESAHMGRPDFRVRGKIFATLGDSETAWGMVRLTPDEQAVLIEAEPAVFEPVPGGWGRRGSTRVRLDRVDPVTSRSALTSAWQRIAPKKLVNDLTERRGSSTSR